MSLTNTCLGKSQVHTLECETKQCHAVYVCACVSSVYFKNFLRLVDLLLHTTHVQPTSVATSTATRVPETAPSGVMMFKHWSGYLFMDTNSLGVEQLLPVGCCSGLGHVVSISC